MSLFFKHFGYFLFKAYIKFMHEALMIRRRYTINLDNLPKDGEKYFVVCNHQNTANDPLNIMFALPFRFRISALARADVFDVHPLFTRFLHWIGLLPAFRLGWEGGNGIEQNFKSFDMVADRVLEGRPLIVFPEAGHTQGHYVDPFTTGVVRMAFHAAKKSGWQEDIKILPSAHHYEDYFAVRSDFVWTIGKAIPLKPYYEEYQMHPNTVLRKIKREMYAEVSSLMLNEGKEDYEEKDFLRNSCLNGNRTASAELPQRLEQDKAFIGNLIENKNYDRIMELSRTLKAKEKECGVSDKTVERPSGYLMTAFQSLLAICLLPLWIVSLWPHAICYKLPTLLLKSDIMFTNSYRYVVSVLLLYPLTALITVVVGLCFGMWLEALLWIALWIPIGLFAWWYYQFAIGIRENISYLLNRKQINEIQELRNEIKNALKQ